MKRIWRDLGLSIALAATSTGSWVLQSWMGWVEFVADQRALGQTAEAFGPEGYIWR